MPFIETFRRLILGIDNETKRPNIAGRDVLTHELLERVHLWTTGNGIALHHMNQLTERADRERELAIKPQFGDALAQLLAVGAAAAVTSQPLASAKAALDAHPSFARSQASLGIVTITASDDASSGMILDYSNGLKARKSDPTEVAVSSIYPAASTRLDSFHAQFPNRATTQDIATADYSAPLGVIEGLLKTVLGIPCATEPADVDAATPGAQYECDLNAYFEDDTSQAIRQCKDDNSVAPCFRFSIDVGCQDGTKRFVVTGFPTRWVPPVRGQCVVTGQN